MDRLIALLALAVSVPTLARAVDITACGQTVPARQAAVLQSDLDCSGSPFGVRLLRRASLDLNGHTIAGGDLTSATVVGVSSVAGDDPIGKGSGNFTIVGPGVIAGTNHPPVSSGTTACVLINAGRALMTSASGVIEVRGCVVGVNGNRLSAQSSTDRGKLEMDHVSVHQARYDGVAVRRLIASDVSAYDNEIGLSVRSKTVLTNVTLNTNGIGFQGGTLVTGSGVTAIGNSNNGIDTCGFGTIDLINVVAMNNGFAGVCGNHVRLTDSTVTDNAVDIVSYITMPVLVDTVCGTSRRVDSTPWGVCTND
jgi:hypothetical protein